MEAIAANGTSLAGYLQVWVIPLTTDHYPGLAVNKPADEDRDESFAFLHRALSILAWLQDAGATGVRNRDPVA